MSLQIPIQKDIGEYDEKIVGKLTLRTLCCLALGFSAAVAAAAVLHLGLKADVSAMTLPIMAAALPFWLAGFCKPYGLPFEKFVPLLASHALNARFSRRVLLRGFFFGEHPAFSIAAQLWYTSDWLFNAWDASSGTNFSKGRP